MVKREREYTNLPYPAYLPGNGGSKQGQEPADGPRPQQPVGGGEGAEGRPEEVAQGGTRAHGLCLGLRWGQQRVSQVKTLHKRRLLDMFFYREFQVFGMNVAEYITDQKSEHNIEVKEEKEIKKVIKK